MAADTKISDLVSSPFPSTYTQTEAASYLPPNTHSKNTLAAISVRAVGIAQVQTRPLKSPLYFLLIRCLAAEKYKNILHLLIFFAEVTSNF